jgi:hypothetical protein
VGEDCYRLLTNNCEHFCEWCLRGKPRSHQVEALLTQPGRALRAMIGLIAWVVVELTSRHAPAREVRHGHCN